jgi:hypothetical protein
MKTRTGFVSNSSSTSFTVHLRQDAKGVNTRAFDLVTQILGAQYGKIKRVEVGEERKTLLEEQKVLIRNLNFIQDQKARLTEISKDIKIVEIVEELWPILNNTGALQYIRQKSKKHSENIIQDTLSNLSYREKEESEKLKFVTSKLKILIGIPDSDFLVQWEEDDMCRPLSDAVPLLIEEGVVTVLEKIRT